MSEERKVVITQSPEFPGRWVAHRPESDDPRAYGLTPDDALHYWQTVVVPVLDAQAVEGEKVAVSLVPVKAWDM